jgi:hypothetical protein
LLGIDDAASALGTKAAQLSVADKQVQVTWQFLTSSKNPYAIRKNLSGYASTDLTGAVMSSFDRHLLQHSPPFFCGSSILRQHWQMQMETGLYGAFAPHFTYQLPESPKQMDGEEVVVRASLRK